MKDTKIEWTDHSWSPWMGCTKVSPGCANCYAETLSKRNPAVLGQWGRGKPRVMAKNWNDPVKWNRNVLGDLDIVPGQPDRFTPYHRPTVFPSLCDWLDDEVPVEWLPKFLQLIHDTPNLTWLLLTKRPENFSARINAAVRVIQDLSLALWASKWIDTQAPSNVWVGASIEDQTWADQRIPALLSIPAAGRFLSVEPLLGPVDIYDWIKGQHWGHSRPSRVESTSCDIHWVIIGGESGPGARPCNVEWIRSLVRQCQSASVPVFVKQLGTFCNIAQPGDHGQGFMPVRFTHPKGGDPAEWPEDLRVREFPEGLR